MSNSKEQVFVTGASSGIGRQVAIELSRSYDLILSGRRAEGLNETLADCTPGAHKTWLYDFSTLETLQEDFEEWHIKNNVNISHFVPCAGNVLVTASRTINLPHINAMFNVNFNAAILLTASLLKRKCSANTLKNIVFISALFSRFGTPAHSIYSATKGALDSAMRSLALELAPKVRVNSICPGGVNTPMARTVLNDPEFYERVSRQYPLGIGQSSDISAVVSFLLSDRARWITGQQIFVDGGRSINMSL